MSKAAVLVAALLVAGAMSRRYGGLGPKYCFNRGWVCVPDAAELPNGGCCANLACERQKGYPKTLKVYKCVPRHGDVPQWDPWGTTEYVPPWGPWGPWDTTTEFYPWRF